MMGSVGPIYEIGEPSESIAVDQHGTITIGKRGTYMIMLQISTPSDNSKKIWQPIPSTGANVEMIVNYWQGDLSDEIYYRSGGLHQGCYMAYFHVPVDMPPNLLPNAKEPWQVTWNPNDEPNHISEVASVDLIIAKTATGNPDTESFPSGTREMTEYSGGTSQLKPRMVAISSSPANTFTANLWLGSGGGVIANESVEIDQQYELIAAEDAYDGIASVSLKVPGTYTFVVATKKGTGGGVGKLTIFGSPNVSINPSGSDTDFFSTGESEYYGPDAVVPPTDAHIVVSSVRTGPTYDPEAPFEVWFDHTEGDEATTTNGNTRVKIYYVDSSVA
jgi:hypothetical protein